MVPKDNNLCLGKPAYCAMCIVAELSVGGSVAVTGIYREEAHDVGIVGKVWIVGISSLTKVYRVLLF